MRGAIMSSRLWRIVTIAIVIAVAWVLGQLLAPALVKALFL